MKVTKEKAHDLNYFADNEEKYDVSIDDDLQDKPLGGGQLDISRSIVAESVTKDMFKGRLGEEVPIGERLKIYVPDEKEINEIFTHRQLKRLKQISPTKFQFSGKNFKFLLSKDGRLFARTKEQVMGMKQFIDKYRYYKSGVFESAVDPTPTQELSYSEIIVEHPDATKHFR
jgi:hypothetical protein